MTHVLVVDDELPFLRILSMNFAARGFRVSAAATGAAALQIVAADHPDVMILDLGLPDLDGTEVIRRLRDGGHGLPIIVVSARDTSQAMVNALNVGANEYLTKPINVGELAKRVEALTKSGAFECSQADPVASAGG